MRLTITTLTFLLLLPVFAQAETAYVTDRLYVSIREGQGPDSPAVKSVATGTEVEVLQRLGGFALVREPEGSEGWIAERYLVASAPTRALLDSTNTELNQAQSELKTVRQQLAASQKSAKDAARQISALEQRLKEQGEAAPATTKASEMPEQAPSPTGVDSEESGHPGDQFSWVWLLIAFAMLVVGFVSGALWLREVNRKKMGGMYLRI
jgi:uncharacterized protein YgiM (DUF1202 family)